MLGTGLFAFGIIAAVAFLVTECAFVQRRS